MASEYQFGHDATHYGILPFTSMGTVPLMKVEILEWVLNKIFWNVSYYKCPIVKIESCRKGWWCIERTQ